MKFLCIECDEAMKLINTSDSEGGSLNVIFQCPNCQRQIAMLTNSMETQMVRSMDVKIGGPEEKTEPMEKLRSSLLSKKDDYTVPEKSDQQDNINSSDPKCPFPEMVSQLEQQKSASEQQLIWTEGAKERIQRIPEFVRSMVSKNIEQHAKEKGYTEINESVMDEVKGSLGM